MLDAVRKARPAKEAVANFERLGRDQSTVDNEPARRLLEKWFGQKDWTSLEESVKQNLEGAALQTCIPE